MPSGTPRSCSSPGFSRNTRMTMMCALPTPSSISWEPMALWSMFQGQISKVQLYFESDQWNKSILFWKKSFFSSLTVLAGLAVQKLDTRHSFTLDVTAWSFTPDTISNYFVICLTLVARSFWMKFDMSVQVYQCSLKSWVLVCWSVS